MPSAPNIDGLPLWLQITITICFGLTTIFVAARGYLRPGPSAGAAMLTAQADGPLKQVQSGIIADMGAIRNLSDVSIRLTTQLEAVEQAIREQTHWTRTQHELDREICARLRELREVLERTAGRT